MNATIDQLLNEKRHPIHSRDIARLSPLAYEHINMLGRYSFTLSQAVAGGNLRSLRNPHDCKDDI